MPVDRTYLDGLRDLLTVPSRIDAAFWEGLDAVFGDGSTKTVWNVLFNPSAAREEDLQQFSERFLHLSPGWTSFVVNTFTNPAVLMGTMFAKGGGIFNLHGEAGPSAAGQQFLKEYAPAWDKLQLRSYNALLGKMGFKQSMAAELLMNERYGRFMEKFKPEYERLRASFGPDWEQAKGRIALHLDGRAVPDLTSRELAASNLLRERILDPAWDHVGTIERIKKSGIAGADTEFIADAEPIGYLTGYYMHTLNRRGWLSNDPGTIVETLANNPVYKNLLNAGVIKPLPFAPDTSISLSSARDSLLDWMQQPGAAKLFNPHLLKRGADAVPDEITDKLLIWDLDKVVPSYLHKAAKTYALQTPIAADEARLMHGRIIPDAVPTEALGEIHGRIRRAWNAGDMAEVDRNRALAQELYHRVRETPEQHSLSYQVTMEAMQQIPGYKPAEAAAGRYFGGQLPVNQRIRARVFHDWYSSLIGTQDIERYNLARVYSNAMSRLHERMTPEVVQELNGYGAKVGMPNFGEKAIAHITEHSDTYNAAGLERALVGYTSANLLGFKPSAIVMNMLQTPQTTIPAIGFGNTLVGMAEAFPRLARAYREAVRFHFQEKAAGRQMPWKESLRVGLTKEMPDFMATGIPMDLNTVEKALGASVDNGAGGFNLDRFTQLALSGFQVAEQANRSIAFYGAKHMYRKMLQVNPSFFGYDAKQLTTSQIARDMDMHAAGVVYDTQFVPGAGRQTPLTKRLSPIGRQFLNYPVSFGNMALDLSIKGALDQRSAQVAEGLGQAYGRQRSWLGYARYMATMAGLTNFGNDVLGVRLGERVQEGVMNLPLDPSQPFAPLPIPPIPGALIAYVNSGLSGKLDRGASTDLPVIGTIPIPKAFVPGGMVLSQMARVMNQTKDGVMQDREGRGLYDFDTKAKMAAMFGLATTESARDDAKVKRLLVTSAKVKEYRHRLAVALASGDANTAAAVREEYRIQPEFSDAPPLAVATQDIVRVRENQRTTRLYRVAKAVGPNIRQIVDPGADPAGWFEPYVPDPEPMMTTRGGN